MNCILVLKSITVAYYWLEVNRMLKEELDRGPDFLRLANALSALYPKNSEEKRLLDAMLLAIPR